MKQTILKLSEPILVESCQDPYGNYFVQDLIELTSSIEREVLVSILSDSIIELGSCKYSSLVIIKLIGKASKSDLRKIFKKLFVPEKLSLCSKNKYLCTMIKKLSSRMTLNDRQNAGMLLEKYPKLKYIQELLSDQNTEH